MALLSDRLQSAYNDISPTNKVLLMLQFYATSSMQRVVGDLAGVSVSSANRIIISLSWEIALLKGRYISFPSRENTDTTKLMFYNIAQFPNVIGTIHCTHIPIVNPCGEDGARVVNRKGFYSLNVQVVSHILGLVGLEVHTTVVFLPTDDLDQNWKLDSTGDVVCWKMVDEQVT